MAVLPVYLSPIINSLYPLPIGTKQSTDLRPVYIGSKTDILGMIPGALSSTLLIPDDLIGPAPSMGLLKLLDIILCEYLKIKIILKIYLFIYS
jgi:hypothetical protein